MTAADKLVKTAEAELGYLEKSKANWNLYGTNCLYSKTKYAGADNVQKYSYDVGHYKKYGWAAWCQSFVAFCFDNTFGKTIADKLLCGKLGSASTMEVKDAMVSAGREVDISKAQPGDIVFRSRSGGGHVGIVKAVKDGKIVSIEGNSSSSDITSWNGGAVVIHTGAPWTWCCRPNWSIAEQETWRWLEVDGIWYYQNQYGKNTYGWKEIQETGGGRTHWYYFNDKGQMLTGMHYIDDKLCLFQPDGPLQGAMCKSDDSGYQWVWDVN